MTQPLIETKVFGPYANDEYDVEIYVDGVYSQTVTVKA